MRKERVWLVSDARRLVCAPTIADGGVVGLAVWDRGGASIRYVPTELAEGEERSGDYMRRDKGDIGKVQLDIQYQFLSMCMSDVQECSGK